MENLSVFKCLDYIDFIKQIIKANSSTYGYKAKLAEAAGCQRSYFSQVLAGTSHLTAEHASGLTVFWNFNDTEADYFINLVLLARAGTKALKEHLKKKIDHYRSDQENILKRISEEKTVLSNEIAAVFYSNWQYLAVTILVTIPKYQTVKAISDRLQLPIDLTKKILQHLEELNLVVRSEQRWITTQKTIHIPKGSPFNSLNHSNWRHQGIQNSFMNDSEAIHYTSVCSVSLSDANKLRELIFDLIDRSRKIVAPSKEEELFCLTCDWFKI